MTNLQIKMMLHYYAICEPYAARDPIHASSAAVKEQRIELVALDLLKVDETSPSGYRITARGLAYVRFLQEMPLPVNTWVLPSEAYDHA